MFLLPLNFIVSSLLSIYVDVGLACVRKDEPLRDI